MSSYVHMKVMIMTFLCLICVNITSLYYVQHLYVKNCYEYVKIISITDKNKTKNHAWMTNNII